jgi:hypothetical protein
MVKEMEEQTPRIRCRTIAETDLPGLADLLTRGFPERSRAYWDHALAQLAQRDAPADCPRFGYMLDCDGAAVGVILLIFSQIGPSGAPHLRCNISSWYVDPRWRGYASLLIASAARRKDTTYFNVSPAPHTLPVIEAQGFKRYCDGQMLCLPALNAPVFGARVEQFDAATDYGADIDASERALLIDHVANGCVALILRHRGRASPFVFLPCPVVRRVFPGAQLVYCRSVDEFVRYAGPLGRRLLREGIMAALVDANGPIAGLIGAYQTKRGPKYFKGPHRPIIGDIAFSEAILFGP